MEFILVEEISIRGLLSVFMKHGLVLIIIHPKPYYSVWPDIPSVSVMIKPAPKFHVRTFQFKEITRLKFFDVKAQKKTIQFKKFQNLELSDEEKVK